MDQAPVPPPPPAIAERCYRHPDVITGVHCTRCGRPICPDCMVPAPVGHQCPDCVRGAKQEFRRPAQRVATGPQRGFSLTNLLLAILVGVYVLEVGAGGMSNLFGGPPTSTLIRLGASIGLTQLPSRTWVGIAIGQQWRLVTAMFLHANLLHIAMNGYVLYFFGNIVEKELGRVRFLLLFFVTGLCASTATYSFGPNNVASVGASGAIFGLFGVFLAYNWRRRELAFYAARMRSALTLIVINLLFTFSLSSVIDWRAHVGGLVAGLIAGVAADGIGSDRRKNALLFGVTLAALLAVAIVLTTLRTQELLTRFPMAR